MDHSCMYINLFQSFAISYHDIVLNYDAVGSNCEAACLLSAAKRSIGYGG